MNGNILYTSSNKTWYIIKYGANGIFSNKGTLDVWHSPGDEQMWIQDSNARRTKDNHDAGSSEDIKILVWCDNIRIRTETGCSD